MSSSEAGSGIWLGSLAVCNISRSNLFYINLVAARSKARATIDLVTGPARPKHCPVFLRRLSGPPSLLDPGTSHAFLSPPSFCFCSRLQQSASCPLRNRPSFGPTIPARRSYHYIVVHLSEVSPLCPHCPSRLIHPYLNSCSSFNFRSLMSRHCHPFSSKCRLFTIECML